MLTNLIVRALGRERAWRLGRSLYMSSRAEIGNDIAQNGEAALIRSAIALHRREAPGRPFVAFDIGANLGEWTAEVAREAASIDWRAELFEPVDGSFARLVERFAGNPNIHCNQQAISSHVGEATMLVVGETSGTNSLNHFPGAEGSSVVVPLTTIDAHLQKIGVDAIDLVKIDVEGHDIEVLRASAPLLADARIGIVQFEYNWRWLASKGSLLEVFDLIRDTSYVMTRIYPDGPKAFDAWNAELDRYFEANYALIRRDIASKLGIETLRWNGSNVPQPA